MKIGYNTRMLVRAKDKMIMDDKLIRRMIFIALGIIIALGAFALLQTLLSMIIPLAVLGIGGFAFYKIVLEGRDAPQAMDDEVAETSAMVVESTAEAVIQQPDTTDTTTPEEIETQAEERLSATEQAKRDYMDSATPAEEILDHINTRKQRLQGDEDN
jgi:hypothetical protein